MASLAGLLESVSIREQCRRIIRGFKAPAGSPERRYARQALLELFGPSGISLAGSVLIALAAVCFTGVTPNNVVDLGDLIPVDMHPVTSDFKPDYVPEKVTLNESLPEPPPPPDSQQPIPGQLEYGGSSTLDPVAAEASPKGSLDGIRDPSLSDEATDLRPILTKSVRIIRNLPGRSEEDRALALLRYGSPDGAGNCGGFGGIGATEGAVIKALRWLKKNQEPDGSWKQTKPAMTGLALLTFLAHSETSASPEFGECVERGLRWLIDNQEQDGHFKGHDAHDYSHPIATYALCEAYAMRPIPGIRDAAEKAISCIIAGQHSSGGWDYNFKQSDRDDTSYMGWCVQALKAAKMAKLENEGLHQALARAVKGLKKNADGTGRFGYTTPHDGTGGLTGVGVLCLQMLGAGRDSEAMKGLMWLDTATCDWEKPWLTSPIYYWYYVTQAKFQAGGAVWNMWNLKFAGQLVKNQKKEANAIKDLHGRRCDIGWWEPPAAVKGHSDGPVMDTCLCTLQLEVYYRYLPTFQSIKPNSPDQPEKNDDLVITSMKSE